MYCNNRTEFGRLPERTGEGTETRLQAGSAPDLKQACRGADLIRQEMNMTAGSACHLCLFDRYPFARPGAGIPHDKLDRQPLVKWLALSREYLLQQPPGGRLPHLEVGHVHGG